MGTWGPGIFSDDTAADVRDDYRERIGDGMPGPEATNEVLATWSEVLADPDEGPIVWLALAATQVRCGRLEPRVRDQAIAIIDGGRDLRRWQDQPTLMRQRERALASLRSELLGPQRAPTRIPRPIRSVWPFEAGSIVAYHRGDGRLLLFRVLATSGTHGVGGGRHGIVDLLDWTGDRPPDAGAIEELPSRAPRDWTAASPHPIGVMILNQRQLDRWQSVVQRTDEERWAMHTLVDSDRLDGLVSRRYEL